MFLNGKGFQFGNQISESENIVGLALAGEAVIVFLLVAVLDIAHALCSAVIRH